ncbi:MAG: ATP-binding protein, partial [Steroidobacter sp.]
MHTVTPKRQPTLNSLGEIELDSMTQLAISAAIVDSSDDAIICKTLDGRIRTWNMGAERLFGYLADEIIGMPITMLIPPGLQYEEENIIAKLKRGERIEHFETTRVRKDGSLVQVSLTVSPVRDAKGNIIAASKLARDISSGKAAEKALEESAKQIAAEATALAKLNHFGSRLWRCRQLNAGLDEILDAAIDVAGATKGYLQLADSGHSRIAVQRGFDSISPEILAALSIYDQSASERALRDGTRISVEGIDNCENESLKALANAAGYQSVIVIPLIDGSDNRIGTISLHFPEPHMVTQQVLRRLDLYARQACDFIQRCRIEDRLRESEISLRDADRRKDEFLAVLAHELRNPLAPIQYALAANKKSRGAPPEQQRYLESVIERQIGNMSRLLDDLLDVSRVTHGTLDLRRESVDLATIIEAAIEAARPVLESRKHSLTIEMPAQPVRLDADPMRLAQVFSNLLVNAGKYTDNEGQIVISASHDARNVTVKVRDNGIGISPDILPRLFTMFTQSREAIGRSAGGLGVGLALVRGLVQLHGGTVTAHSAGAGQGSEFVVRLPVARAGQAVHDVAATGETGKTGVQRI